ncbi:MAG: hypothetical protein KDB01_27040 [Planctomycetaceae bacterium]|nr:hypothetical protein [Planctomycetaceae bacterium]
MATRGMLHKNKLKDFISWLDSEGIAHREGKGVYEVFQIKTRVGWKAVFLRHRSDHVTLPYAVVPIVKKYMEKHKDTAIV